MSNQPPATDPAAHHVRTLRPRAAIVLGGLTMLVLAALLVTSGGSDLGYLGALLLGIALAHVLLVRPSVRMSIEGVSVHNPFRRTFVPWRLVEDVSSRWNLEVYAGERAISAWAISAHIERPKGHTPFGLGGGVARAMKPWNGRSGEPQRPAASESGGTAEEHDKGALTAQRAARLLRAVREEWVEAVRDGSVIEPAAPQVVRSWEPYDLAVVGVGLLLLLAGTLT